MKKVSIESEKVGIYNWITTVYINGRPVKHIETENRYKALLLEKKILELIKSI